MRLSKSFVLKQLAVIAGLVGAGTLLSLPALAASSYGEGATIAQSTNSNSGGSTDSGTSGANPANPDSTGGEAFEEAPGSQPLPNAGQQDGSGSGSTMDEGTGSGAGGVQEDEVNPANPDATGGGAFEREPSGQPLPSDTQDMNDSTAPSGTTSPSGTTTNEGTGSGQGGYNNPVNPANPDPTGGEAYEQTPGTQPLPGANEQSGGASSTYEGSGTTTNDGAGGGAGGTSSAVRGLW